MAENAEIAMSAGLDESDFIRAEKRMDVETKAFVKGAEKELSRVAKAATSVEKHYDRVNAAAQRAQKTVNSSGGGGSGNYRVGQAALQAQDVAVQLQGGAKYATVIAQQGSQIASIFGPTGAIVGGLLAIGAAMVSFAMGTEAAKKKVEEAAEQLKKFKELNDEISKGMFSAKDETENIKARLRGGELVEKQLIRQKDMTHEIQEVWAKFNAGVIRTGKDAGKEQVSSKDATALEALIRQKYAAKDVEEVEERIGRLLEHSKDAYQAGASAAQGRMEMEKEILNLEIKHAEKFNQEEDHYETVEKRARAIVQHVKDITAYTQKGLRSFLDNYNPEAQARSKAASVITQGGSIVKQADKLLDPQGTRAKLKLEKAQDRADRRIAERQANESDALERNLNRNPMTKAEREKFIKSQTDRAHEVRHPKTAVNISKEDIDSLAAKIAAENAKLISK